MSTTAKTTGFPFLGLLGLLLVYLKLTNQLHWSWWWVTAPYWGPVAAFIVVAVPIVLAAAVCSIASEL